MKNLPQPTPRRDYRLKLIETTHPPRKGGGRERSLLGCIVLAAIGKEPPTPPMFKGKAIIASNGDVFCDFVDDAGTYHVKARVGDDEDFTRNLVTLTVAAGLNDEERVQFLAMVNKWIATDERSKTRIAKVMQV